MLGRGWCDNDFLRHISVMQNLLVRRDMSMRAQGVVRGNSSATETQHKIVSDTTLAQLGAEKREDLSGGPSDDAKSPLSADERTELFCADLHNLHGSQSRPPVAQTSS